ncbi:hypothetical protein GCM10023347_26500 [Streptomyces chumphonensis]|uniref:Caspase domain-containing protein n=1 Tax=Streptomyces chumphonensis TaxID=1214925 RepID=A0A927ICW1_9ACTN|nr:hypothetical protein [Streptomyces chumphonensis]MBD3932462.1 hypothetical protein [Streptomyces chumphonensis]
MLDPGRTLAIVCGADSWPSMEQFEDAAAFRTTADAVRAYLTGEHLRLPTEHLLWLFGEAGAQHHLDVIQDFLVKAFGGQSPRGAGWTVLFLYTGHGFFPPSSQEYCLALHDTRPPLTEETSLRASSLGRLLRAVAPDSDRVLILDSCFAAAAVPHMQGPLDEVVGRRVRTVVEEEPRSGPGSVAVLCAADRDTWAEMDGTLSWTTFGRSLVDVLTAGEADVAGALSLVDVCRVVGVLQREKGAPVPEVHAPTQKAGDLARVPLFPNPAGAASGVAGPGRRQPAPNIGPTRTDRAVAERIFDVLAVQPDRLVRKGVALSGRLVEKAARQGRVRAGEAVGAVAVPPGRLPGSYGYRMLVFTDRALYAVTKYGRLRCPYGELGRLRVTLTSEEQHAGHGRFVTGWLVNLRLGADDLVEYGFWGRAYAQRIHALLSAVQGAAEG